MKILHLLSILSLLFSLSACNTKPVTAIRHSTNYNSVLNDQANLLVIPPKIRVATVNGLGKEERMYNYETRLEAILNEAIIKALSDKGYTASLLDNTQDFDKNVYDNISALHTAYSNNFATLYNPLFLEEEKAFSTHQTFNNVAAQLGKSTHSNVVVLANYTNVVNTNSKRITEFAIDALLHTNISGDAENATLNICFIDTKNDTLLWSNINFDQKSIYGDMLNGLTSKEELAKKDNETIHRLTSSLLAKLPNKSDLLKPITALPDKKGSVN